MRLLWTDTEISVATAARILKTSPDTVMRMLESGLLRGYQLTGKRGWWRVSYESVVDHLNRTREIHALDSPEKSTAK